MIKLNKCSMHFKIICRYITYVIYKYMYIYMYV